MSLTKDEISSIIKERIDNFEINPDEERGITIIVGEDEKLLSLKKAVTTAIQDDNCIAVVGSLGGKFIQNQIENFKKLEEFESLKLLKEPKSKHNRFGYIKRKFR